MSQCFLTAAQKPDQNWPFGINEYPGVSGFGNAIIRFIPSGPKVEKVAWRMNFESTVGAWSDSSGQLLMFTNGCYIANALGDTMPNGAGLNPGTVHDMVCPDNGYISPRGALILALPGSRRYYYVFHLGVRYEDGEQTLGPFYYTVVDMEAGSGKGAVIEKNIVIDGGNLEPFSSVRHGNGRDWWLLVPEFGTNLYKRFLFSPTGVKQYPAQQIGPTGDCVRTGSTIFSPDGSRFARHQNCRTIVFDFDRCSGELSNPVSFYLPPTTFGGGGVAFSEDGARIFVSTHLAVLSADLQNNPLKLDTLIGSLKIAGAGLNHFQAAPDGSFYFSLMHRSNFLPKFTFFSSNSSFTFSQKGIILPVNNVKTIPNFPNFSLLDLADSPCDTLGITAYKEVTLPKPLIKTFPNPAQTVWQIDVSSISTAGSHISALRVYDISGRLKHERNFDMNELIQIDLTDWMSGLYVWKIITSDGDIHGGLVEKL